MEENGNGRKGGHRSSSTSPDWVDELWERLKEVEKKIEAPQSACPAPSENEIGQRLKTAEASVGILEEKLAAAERQRSSLASQIRHSQAERIKHMNDVSMEFKEMRREREEETAHRDEEMTMLREKADAAERKYHRLQAQVQSAQKERLKQASETHQHAKEEQQHRVQETLLLKEAEVTASRERAHQTLLNQVHVAQVERMKQTKEMALLRKENAKLVEENRALAEARTRINQLETELNLYRAMVEGIPGRQTSTGAASNVGQEFGLSTGEEILPPYVEAVACPRAVSTGEDTGAFSAINEGMKESLIRARSAGSVPTPFMRRGYSDTHSNAAVNSAEAAAGLLSAMTSVGGLQSGALQGIYEGQRGQSEGSKNASWVEDWHQRLARRNSFGAGGKGFVFDPHGKISNDKGKEGAK